LSTAQIVLGSIVVWLAGVRPVAEAYRWFLAKIFHFNDEAGPDIDDEEDAAMFLGWVWPIGIPLTLVGIWVSGIAWLLYKIFSALHWLFFLGWRPTRSRV
jgi:hypothetical protein